MTADTTGIPTRRARPIYRDLSVQILVAMLLGVLCRLSVASKRGFDEATRRSLHQARPHAGRADHLLYRGARHRQRRRSQTGGRVAIKSLVYFEVVTSFALILSLVLVNLWAPGAGMHVDPATLGGQGLASVEASAKQVGGWAEFLLGIVPSSAIGAFADGDVLPVLFFSLLFAFALLTLGPKAQPVLNGIETIQQVLFKMIGFVMYTAPIGAFGAIAFTVGKFGPSSLIALGRLVGEFYVVCLLFVLLVFWPIAQLARLSLLRLIRYLAAELLIVAGTSSGESVFPRLVSKLRALGCEEPSSRSCSDGLRLQSRRYLPLLGDGVGVPGAGRGNRSLAQPAIGTPGDPADHLERWRGASPVRRSSCSLRRCRPPEPFPSRAWDSCWASTGSCRRLSCR